MSRQGSLNGSTSRLHLQTTPYLLLSWISRQQQQFTPSLLQAWKTLRQHQQFLMLLLPSWITLRQHQLCCGRFPSWKTLRQQHLSASNSGRGVHCASSDFNASCVIATCTECSISSKCASSFHGCSHREFIMTSGFVLNEFCCWPLRSSWKITKWQCWSWKGRLRCWSLGKTSSSSRNMLGRWSAVPNTWRISICFTASSPERGIVFNNLRLVLTRLQETVMVQGDGFFWGSTWGAALLWLLSEEWSWLVRLFWSTLLRSGIWKSLWCRLSMGAVVTRQSTEAFGSISCSHLALFPPGIVLCSPVSCVWVLLLEYRKLDFLGETLWGAMLGLTVVALSECCLRNTVLDSSGDSLVTSAMLGSTADACSASVFGFDEFRTFSMSKWTRILKCSLSVLTQNGEMCSADGTLNVDITSTSVAWLAAVMMVWNFLGTCVRHRCRVVPVPRRSDSCVFRHTMHS